MRRKLASLLTAAVLSVCGTSAWAQQLPVSAALGLPTVPGATEVVDSKCAAPACPVNDCDNCATGYFTGGAGVYFITPFYSSNSAGFYRATAAGPNAEVNQQNFGQHMNAAPDVWLGYTFDNGWGAKVRYFGFNGSQDASVVGDPATTVISNVFPFLDILPIGDKFTSSRSLSLQVIDLEATNNFVWGRWAVLASVGLRYAHISSGFDADEYNAAGAAFRTYSANATFNGIGLTAALEGRRRIADSDFYFYGMGRASLLYGSLHRSAAQTLELPRVADPSLTAVSDESTVIGVGELEAGGEWAKVIGRVRVFAQIALIGQMWVGGSSDPNGAGVLEQPLSFIGLGGFGSTTNNFGFFGGVFRAGINY